MPIRPLPTLLINQIAAGEVIERPASVVKELVENSIDADATRIDVVIENGGRDLIRVTDDGSGIPPEELTLALAPHATSKITEADDLNSIATMGFRGEAIASIASVSRMTIRSRPRGSDAANEIEAEAGDAKPVRPASGPPGTSASVRNLFFNTPARRKFLRTDQTECNRVADVIQTIAVSHPAIGFTLKIGDRGRIDLPPDQTARRRALAVMGDELADELLELESDTPEIGMWGLLGRPGIARGTSRHLRVFLNGRPINDRTVMHAIREAYRGLIAPDRYPTVVLSMTIDPTQVDVNVHPAKAEVRFRNQSLVHRAVLEAIRRVLSAADLVPEIDLTRAHPTQPQGGAPPISTPAISTPAISTGRVPFGSGLPVSPGPAGPAGFVYTEVKQAMADGVGAGVGGGSAAATEVRPETLTDVRPVVDAMQVHNAYIVTQDDEGLVIIDQHALHERIMFELLCERIATGDLESQRLLLPAMVEVDGSQRETLETLKPLLGRIGIEAEVHDTRTIAVTAFTSLLFERRVDPIPFMQDVLTRGEPLARGDDAEGALHEVLDMMSCKAAIKAGDHLTPQEMQDLLKQRHLVDRSSRCPHGRPTTLRLTRADLDRQFGR